MTLKHFFEAFCNDHKQNIPCSIRTDDGWRYTEYIYMKVTVCLEINSINCLVMSLAYACIQTWSLRVKDVNDSFFFRLTMHYAARADIFGRVFFHGQNGSQNFRFYKCYDICFYNFCDKHPLIWKNCF